METPYLAQAYNGELLPVPQGMTEDNTVGSLSEAQRSVIIGSLLGDGANALQDECVDRVQSLDRAAARLQASGMTL